MQDSSKIFVSDLQDKIKHLNAGSYLSLEQLEEILKLWKDGLLYRYDVNVRGGLEKLTDKHKINPATQDLYRVQKSRVLFYAVLCKLGTVSTTQPEAYESFSKKIADLTIQGWEVLEQRKITMKEEV